MKKLLAIAVLVAVSFLCPWKSYAAEQADISPATPPPPAQGDAFLDFLKSIKPSFYVDTSYIYNFNDPDDEVNTLRVFDNDHNEFNLHLFQLGFKKTPTLEGGIADFIGFGVKLDFGEDASIFDSAGLGDGDDEFDLQEAYIHILAPIGSGLNIYAGKFVTLAGAEVIESKNNLNFSRSFLFGFAIPFTHTGVRANYAVGPLGFTLGVNNGWDVVDDNNGGKTIESQVSLALGPASLYVTGYFGDEQDDEESAWRKLIDVVASVTPFDGLTLTLNGDYGWDEVAGDGVTWWGAAGYVNYEINKMLRVAVRGEYFADEDGFRTGTDQNLWEVTPTLAIKPFCNSAALDNLEWRIEYRFDKSDEDVFVDEDELTDTQHTVSTELLYYFTLE